MDKPPKSNMGPRRTLRLRITPLDHPNPGKMAQSFPAAPMRVAKDVMYVLEMQAFSIMLKKNNTGVFALALK